MASWCIAMAVSSAEVNVGGLHFSPGKQEMLPFVYVDRQDLAVFRAFCASGHAPCRPSRCPAAGRTGHRRR